jgi:hypothetical protein
VLLDGARRGTREALRFIGGSLNTFSMVACGVNVRVRLVTQIGKVMARAGSRARRQYRIPATQPRRFGATDYAFLARLEQLRYEKRCPTVSYLEYVGQTEGAPCAPQLAGVGLSPASAGAQRSGRRQAAQRQRSGSQQRPDRTALATTGEWSPPPPQFRRGVEENLLANARAVGEVAPGSAWFGAKKGRRSGGCGKYFARSSVPLGRLATLALRCTRASTSSSVLWARNPRGVDQS